MKQHGPPPTGFHPVSAMDFLPLAQLRDLQLKRLQAIVQRAYDNVTLFRQRMKDRGSLLRLRASRMSRNCRSPKRTIWRETYPFGLFAQPMADIVRVHASSGPRQTDCSRLYAGGFERLD